MALPFFVEDDYPMLPRGRNLFPVEEVREVPVTFSVAAGFSIYNALAATLVAQTSKISLNTIAQTLRTLVP